MIFVNEAFIQRIIFNLIFLILIIYNHFGREISVFADEASIIMTLPVQAIILAEESLVIIIFL